MINVFLVLCLALFFVYFLANEKNQIHMLQLNSYRNERYFLWIRRNISKAINPLDLLPLIGVCIIYSGRQIPGFIVIMLIYLVLFFTKKKPKEKKKLVYTKRVNRLIFTLALVYAVVIVAELYYLPWEVSVNYIVLICLSLVLINTFVLVVTLLCNTINKPFEDAINLYYYKDAQKKIKKMTSLVVIGITGSYGKTSTKHVIHKILSKSFNVLMTPASYNTTMGVVKVVRNNLKPTHEIFIAEMGAKSIGDIEELCELVMPKYGVLTSIGPQHLESFKTIENVKKAKFELIASLPVDGVGFENIDDENIQTLPEPKCKVISYGIQDSTAKFRAENIKFNSRGSTFEVVRPDGNRANFQTKLLGRHNIYNILSGVAIASELGMDLETISYAVKDLESVEHRLQLRLMPSGVTIIDDAYNANPVGSKMALEVLAQMDGEMKIMITPGMIELGDQEYELNKTFGEYAAAACDYVILVGEKQTLSIQEGLKGKDFPEDKIFVALNIEEAFKHLNTIAKPGSVVLIENDLTDDYNE
ncbi:MAG: UDP-N-acetylmuramoyl-tripeptide--D-alanyl-D-alanine ligase [Clostridiaceae bacterium]|nr:UDP-N-acetylmuramoyl-tripeptide--D-alanyl-D-alanine ligase [Clostridiaceae bacterium]